MSQDLNLESCRIAPGSVHQRGGHLLGDSGFHNKPAPEKRKTHNNMKTTIQSCGATAARTSPRAATGLCFLKYLYSEHHTTRH